MEKIKFEDIFEDDITEKIEALGRKIDLMWKKAREIHKHAAKANKYLNEVNNDD